MKKTVLGIFAFFVLVAACLMFVTAFAQQPQVTVPNAQPLQGVNSKWVNGTSFGGYAPTCTTPLTCNTLSLTMGPGTCFDSSGTRHAYAGGTLTMTGSVTNYIYLTASSCAVTQNTSAYPASGIMPIAEVVTSGSAITGITDDRTIFGGAGGTGGGGGGGNQIKECIVTTGDPATSSPILTTSNNSPAQCANNFGADVVITGVACYVDAGTPTVTPILTGGSGTSIVSSAISCSAGTWVAGAVNGTPTIHTFSSNAATCASTPCTLDSNITTIGGSPRYMVMVYVGTTTGGSTTPLALGTCANHQPCYNNSGTLGGIAPGVAGTAMVSQGTTSTPAFAGCLESNGIFSRNANYTLDSSESDRGTLQTFNGSSLTATLPSPPTDSTWCVNIQNLNSSTLTVSRNSLTINGGTSNLTVPQYQIVTVWTDGSNYFSTLPYGAGFSTSTSSVNAQGLPECADTSGSGSVQSCNTSPTFSPVAGECVVYTTTTTNTGSSLTVNVNSLGAKHIAKWQTSTTLNAGDVQSGAQTPICYDGTNWDITTIGNPPAVGILDCADTSGSGTAQTCNTTPTFTPTAGSCVVYTTTTSNTGNLTVNINSLGAKSVAKWQTTTSLAVNDVRANSQTPLCYDGTNWEITTIGNVPSGGGGGAGMTLLCTAVASGATELDFTSSTNCGGANPFSGAYDMYVVYVYRVTVNTNGASIGWQFSTNGGSSYDTGNNYWWQNSYADYNAVSAGGYNPGSTGSTNIALFTDTTVSGAGQGFVSTATPTHSSTFQFYDPQSTSNYKTVIGDGWSWYTGASNTLRFRNSISGEWRSTSAANAFRAIVSTGTFSGKIMVFGVGGSGGGGGGSLTLLCSSAAASSAELDFSSSSNCNGQNPFGQYDNYVLEIGGLVPATNNTDLQLQFSTNGGSSWDTTSGHYAWSSLGFSNTGNGNNGNQSTTAIALSGAQVNTGVAASGTTSGSFHINTTSGIYPRLFGTSGFIHDTGTPAEGFTTSGIYLSTTAINAFRVLMATGNITSGFVRLYGVTTTGGGGSACSGMCLIDTQTASSSASLNFVNDITTTYDVYDLECFSIVPPSTGTPGFALRASTNNGSSYDSTSGHYQWEGNQSTNSPFSGAIGSSSDTALHLTGTNESPYTSNYSINLSAKLYNPLNASLYKSLTDQAQMQANDGNFYVNTISGTYNSTTAVNAFQVLFTSGNITSGTCKLYGLSH